jgi:hypothetical protein
LVRQPLFGLFYESWMMDDVECGAVGVMAAAETGVLWKSLPSATLYTTNPTFLVPGYCMVLVYDLKNFSPSLSP